MGKTQNIDSEMLSHKIDNSGYKINYICSQLGISRTGLWKKVNGDIPFKVPEVFVICSLLSLSEDEKMKIFYPKEQPESCI